MAMWRREEPRDADAVWRVNELAFGEPTESEPRARPHGGWRFDSVTGGRKRRLRGGAHPVLSSDDRDSSGPGDRHWPRADGGASRPAGQGHRHTTGARGA